MKPQNPAGRPYPELAARYARDVLSGDIPACVWVRLACQRYLGDLAREDTAWMFSEIHAARACKFIELLPHVRGRWARDRQRIRLEPWQIFIVCNIFGFVYRETGLRRYRTAYIEVPRKNAKSTLSSGIGLYMLVADREAGAEIYSAATTRDQAKIVWQMSKRMVERSPGMQARFGVSSGSLSIYVDHTDSVFKPLSRDQGGNHDGLNVHLGIIDEVHAHKTRDLYDVLETATGARDQSLLLMITTSGSDRTGICYEQRTYLTEILNDVSRKHPELDIHIKGGHVADESYFGLIYTIDDADRDRWDQPEVWRKANPNYGVSVAPDDLERKVLKAQRRPAAMNNFLTKHLDVWVGAHSAWLNMLLWARQADRSKEIEHFAGCRAWLAVDLASKKDIASVAIIIEHGHHWRLFVKNYCPEEMIEDSDNAQYAVWAESGRLIATDGSATDYGQIEQDIDDLCRLLDVQELAYDPWQANYLVQRLQGRNLLCVELRQTVQNMSEPMKELEKLLITRELWHDGCPVLEWMASNVIAFTDAKDNIYPRKEHPDKKIDGIVAAIMALNRALADEQDTASIYETRGVVHL